MRYSAFISYNHRDRKEASWLHRTLETYRIPKSLHGREGALGTIGPRLPPVFQDREELAGNADLAASVLEALQQSASLVVICSPNAVQSRWVNEEIRAFTAMGRRDRIQCLIVKGEPVDALPPALFENGGTEPLACDIREGQDGRPLAKLKLLAGILGVAFDDLRQRDLARRQRQLMAVAAVSAAGFLAMSGLAGFAVIQRNEAVRQRDIARQKTLTAERTVTFVKSLFEVSDPSESRGDTITAREILDRGARELEQGLTDEPTVKAQLSTTLGEVYGGLGMLRKADAILRRTMELPGVDAQTRARQLAALGESQWRQGNYRTAAASQQKALALLGKGGDDRGGIEARARLGLSDAQVRLGDYPAAERNAQAALAAHLKTVGPDRPEVALDYERLGEIAFFRDDVATARDRIGRALAIRLKTQGSSHPLVADDLNTLASIAYMQRDAVSAERDFRRALKSYEAVLGPDHPNVGGALNNLGRLLIERRAFAEAEPLLRRAVAIETAQKDDTAADLVFDYANLAIALRGLGRTTEADATFAKAEGAARANKHRNLAPILVERAELACGAGDTARGLAMLDEARPIMKRDYPDDAWRSALVELARGDCLARSGRRAVGAALLRANAAPVQARWPADSLYGERLAAMLKRAG